MFVYFCLRIIFNIIETLLIHTNICDFDKKLSKLFTGIQNKRFLNFSGVFANFTL